jgi:hypothetical protein
MFGYFFLVFFVFGLATGEQRRYEDQGKAEISEGFHQ